MTDEIPAGVLQLQIESTADAVDDIATRVSQIDNAIRGNGGRGLCTKLELLESRVQSIEEFVSELKSLRRWMATGAIAMVASALWSGLSPYL
jgi:hypothetical protein